MRAALALTAAVMFAYYALLIRSYGVGDMSVVYPLARGLAPVLTTIAAFFAIGETLGPGQIVAVAMISLGIMALSLGAGAGGAAVGFAVATGVCVATYSFFAGVDCRVPPDPPAGVARGLALTLISMSFQVRPSITKARWKLTRDGVVA